MRLEPAHDRTYEHVLDRQTGTWLTLADYIGQGDYGDVVEHKRVGLKLKLNNGELRYVCPFCEEAMTLASHPIRDKSVRRFYFKHQDQHSPCAGEQGLTEAAICAKRFAHCKEGAAHKQVKAWLIESLSADPAFSQIDAEMRWKDIDGTSWRQPDVQCHWRSERCAFEAQLSTTFLHVITKRMQFYERNKGRLLWLFCDLDPKAFALSLDDIFFSNNRNAFRISQETVSRSVASSRFALECVWYEPADRNGRTVDQIQRQIIFFDQLTFDVSATGVPRTFYFDYEGALATLKRKQRSDKEEANRLHRERQKQVSVTEDGDLREEMESLFTKFPSQWEKYEDRWIKVRAQLARRGFHLPFRFYDSTGPFYLLMAAYSAKRGEVVGCKLKNFTALANSLFDQHKDALWVFSVMMQHYNRATEMLAQGNIANWKTRRDEYKKAWKVGDPFYAPNHDFDDVLKFLFPDAPDRLWGDPV